MTQPKLWLVRTAGEGGRGPEDRGPGRGGAGSRATSTSAGNLRAAPQPGRCPRAGHAGAHPTPSPRGLCNLNLGVHSWSLCAPSKPSAVTVSANSLLV